MAIEQSSLPPYNSSAVNRWFQNITECSILPCSAHTRQETTSFFSFKNLLDHCDPNFFCYISVCVYVSPPLFLLHTVPLSFHSASVFLLYFTREGLHRRTCALPPRGLIRFLTAGRFQPQKAMCSLLLSLSPAIGRKRM